MVTGAEKAEALKRAASDPPNPSKCPASGVYPIDGELTWWADLDAGPAKHYLVAWDYVEPVGKRGFQIHDQQNRRGSGRAWDSSLAEARSGIGVEVLDRPGIGVPVGSAVLSAVGPDAASRNGRFSLPRFRRLFDRFDIDRDDALDGEDLARLFAGKKTDLIGHLGSKAEFGLLFGLAGQERNGKRVLTRDRLKRFYNGSLFYQLARKVATCVRLRQFPAATGRVTGGL